VDDEVDVGVTLEIRGERVVVTLDVALEDIGALENVLSPSAVDDIVSAINAKYGPTGE